MQMPKQTAVVVVKVEVVHDKEVRARVLTSGDGLLKAAYGAVIRLVVEEAVEEAQKKGTNGRGREDDGAGGGRRLY
ncbi:hypothetical protein TYRP_001828 [Tyrophagus putrescentiae]|nr:hypothetical protein TYRP_001828 [Tyrophagus putrescentiae]